MFYDFSTIGSCSEEVEMNITTVGDGDALNVAIGFVVVRVHFQGCSFFVSPCKLINQSNANMQSDQPIKS